MWGVSGPNFQGPFSLYDSGQNATVYPKSLMSPLACNCAQLRPRCESFCGVDQDQKSSQTYELVWTGTSHLMNREYDSIDNPTSEYHRTYIPKYIDTYWAANTWPEDLNADKYWVPNTAVPCCTPRRVSQSPKMLCCSCLVFQIASTWLPIPFATWDKSTPIAVCSYSPSHHITRRAGGVNASQIADETLMYSLDAFFKSTKFAMIPPVQHEPAQFDLFNNILQFSLNVKSKMTSFRASLDPIRSERFS